MEFEKQNNFEEEWRKAFEGASMTPSDELWGRIESDLEKKKKRPLLFFLKPSLMATGLAAALALVLGGILFFNQQPKVNLAQNKLSQSKNTSKPAIENEKKVTEGQKEAIISANDLATIKDNTKTTKAGVVSSPVSAYAENTIPIASELSRLRTSEPTVAFNQAVTTVDKTTTGSEEHAGKIIENSSANIALADNKTALTKIESLDGKKYRYFGSRYTMNRNKLAFDSEIPENAENTALASNDSKFWVGLQSGLAPFNPNMKLGNLNSVAYSAANDYAQLSNGSVANPGDKGSLSVSKPQNSIKSGLAVNSGVAFGYQISDKWHVESGVKYLRGNSTLETNTYAFQNNGYVNTFLGNYLLQNSAKDYSMVNNSNTVVADASQFGNRYEYLMIPMQMAYEIGLTKKLGLNLLAGFSTDIFLQNSITTDNGLVRSKNTINSESRIYKPVNFSGLGGVKASYRISRHWQANIGTSYQRALFSGMSSSVDLNMRLQMFGINYGLNYRF